MCKVRSEPLVLILDGILAITYCFMDYSFEAQKSVSIKHRCDIEFVPRNSKRLFISVNNQLDAQNFCFTISLFHASTCFEHM